VCLSAASFGVKKDDVKAIYDYLDGTYNNRCAPPLKASKHTPTFLIGTNPSICSTDPSCPIAMDSTCPVAIQMETSKLVEPSMNMNTPMDKSMSPMDTNMSPMDTSRSAPMKKIAELSADGKNGKKLRTSKGN
jgi:hypothetical protein